MSDDLVKRLRMDIEPNEGDMEAAADLIEAKAARIAKLEAALERIASGIVAAAIRTAAGVSPGEHLSDAEQDRDVFFNRLGRITEHFRLPVDATAQRIIEAIQERIDNEREACASVEVRLTVPDGAETWTPLEAWEEAIIAFDEAFRGAIRAALEGGGER